VTLWRNTIGGVGRFLGGSCDPVVYGRATCFEMMRVFSQRMGSLLLTRWISGPDGRSPELPQGVDSFQVLFSSEQHAVVSASCSDPSRLTELEVCSEAAATLRLGFEYTPAMARARHKVKNAYVRESGEMFLERVCEVLKDELGRQADDPAVRVKSLIEEVGYRNVGEYVWALSISSDGKRLTWAASDADVYTDPIHTFEISETVRQRLMRARQ